MVIWCSSCQAYYTADERHICPTCHQRSTEMRCYRCGHTWTLSSRRLPKACPSKKCKSPYWNRARTMGRTKEEEKE